MTWSLINWRFTEDEVHTFTIHSVSKFHFLAKNYKFSKSLQNGQFLFLCQNWLFLAVKKNRLWIFTPKLESKIVISWFYLGNFCGQNRVDFWSKSSNIWNIFDSKTQEYFWILALKFKLDDLRDFIRIQFLDKNMTFDTVCDSLMM